MSTLNRTSLNGLHRRLGARMAPFAGYDMPIQFKKGIVAEHVHTRTQAGLFDVSHMGQMKFSGKDRVAFLEWVTPVDLQRLSVGEAQLSFIPNADGGVRDDCIISRYDNYDWLVCNAGNKHKVQKHFEQLLHQFYMENPNRDIGLEFIDRSLIAIQGPRAAEVLGNFVPDLETMNFMNNRPVSIEGIDVQITRCGYTGEDGFEISVPHDRAEYIAGVLLGHEAVQMIGLGARDSLRTEAGMCLYGHELSEDINPLAAKLMWCVSKRRLAEGGFIGHEKIVELKQNEKELVPRVRVGIVSSPPVARQGCEVAHPETGAIIGAVTSGLPSPTLGKSVAQAYLDRAFTGKGTNVVLHVKGKKVAGEVVPLPFVKTNYYRRPQQQ